MKKNLFSLCIIIFSICCIGCGKENQRSKETLTVCVEAKFEEEAREVLDLWESSNDGVKAELEVIPKDSDTRKIKISSIRTELMSGGGPDVFFLSSQGVEDSESFPCLFPYPEKIMYTDTFLPLDTFLEQAEYANPENWNQKILEVGQTEKGQMVLPLTYRYQKYAFPKADLGEVDLPSSWDTLRKCENPVIQNEMFIRAYSFYPLFGKLADYKEGKLRVSKEELQSRAKEAAEYILFNENMEWKVDKLVITGTDSEDFYHRLANAQEEMVVFGFPNIDGGVTANIDAYVAVNRNTTIQDKVFSFLDLLFSDEILCGQGMKVGEKNIGNILYYQIGNCIIHNQYLAMKYSDLSKSDLVVLEESDKRINAVCFYSDLEKDLENMFWLYFQSYYHGEDESKQTELVSKVYDAMLMKVLE